MTAARHLAAVPQLALDETLIEDAELEESLEHRQELKDAASEARADYKLADDEAKAAIEKQELPEGKIIRVGRFRIERKTVAARKVSFETSPGSRVSISMVGGNDD